jgi:hypothetical protein
MYQLELTGNNYLKTTDHWIAISNFEIPEEISYYPLQDIKYKKLGGRNWRKKY